jgi:hypothetical protein
MPTTRGYLPANEARAGLLDEFESINDNVNGHRQIRIEKSDDDKSLK